MKTVSALLALALSASAQTNMFTDANWATLRNLPGPTLFEGEAVVYAMAVDSSGGIYVGGEFNFIGGEPASSIAEWNGDTWLTVGSGITNSIVYALAFDKAGNLYAGGAFTSAGGVPATNIAKWNGTNWSALGSGLGAPEKGDVAALAFDQSGNLYAGGSFTNAGGVPAKRIAEWNGTNWSALSSGMNKAVWALALDNAGNLYAGGEFTNAGGVSANGIAKWNGTNWSPLGEGLVGLSPAAAALAFDHSGFLYASGGFTNAGGVAANFVAKWDGTNWSALGSGMNYFGLSLALDNSGNVYAGGAFTNAGGVSASFIAKLNGTNWSALGSGVSGFNAFPPPQTEVNAMAFDRFGNLFVGGYFGWAGTNGSMNKTGLCGDLAEALLSKSGQVFPPTVLGAGTNVITAQVTPGYTYALDLATDLTPPVSWTPQATNTPANASLVFTNVSASAQGFYRLRYVPQ